MPKTKLHEPGNFDVRILGRGGDRSPSLSRTDSRYLLSHPTGATASPKTPGFIGSYSAGGWEVLGFEQEALPAVYGLQFWQVLWSLGCMERISSCSEALMPLMLLPAVIVVFFVQASAVGRFTPLCPSGSFGRSGVALTLMMLGSR